MMKQTNKHGFTLIELLVVIAIIGILASVVLASLNIARTKGTDANVKANLSGVRTAAEIQYDNLGNKYNTTNVAVAGSDCGATYTAGTFLADTGISLTLSQAKVSNGNAALYCNINASGDSYAIASPLKTSGTWWCIDSAGASKGTQGTGAVGYTALSGAVTAALTDNADVTCN